MIPSLVPAIVYALHRVGIPTCTTHLWQKRIVLNTEEFENLLNVVQQEYTALLHTSDFPISYLRRGLTNTIAFIVS